MTREELMAKAFGFYMVGKTLTSEEEDEEND